MSQELTTPSQSHELLPQISPDEFIADCVQRKGLGPTDESNDPLYNTKLWDTYVYGHEEMTGSYEEVTDLTPREALCQLLIDQATDGATLLGNGLSHLDPNTGNALRQSLQEAVLILTDMIPEELPNSISEAEIALRDLAAVTLTSSVALGLVPNQLGAYVGAHNQGNKIDLQTRSKSTVGEFTTCYESIEWAGDQEESYQRAEGYVDYPETYHYPGKVRVAVTESRVELSFTHELTEAQRRYTQNIDTEKGVIETDTVSVRIDKDPFAPHGFSIDIGRDPRVGEKISRPGDLLGTLLMRARENGSHFYTEAGDITDESFKHLSQNVSRLLQAMHEQERLNLKLMETSRVQSGVIKSKVQYVPTEQGSDAYSWFTEADE